MIAKHIYINKQGVPCAPTMEVLELQKGPVPGFKKWSEQGQIIKACKESAIPIREEDFHYMNLGPLRLSMCKLDNFYSVEPYKFEIEIIATGTNEFNVIDMEVARIIQPAEPIKSKKKNTAYTIKQMKWQPRKGWGYASDFGYIIEPKEDSTWLLTSPRGQSLYDGKSLEETKSHAQKHFEDRVKRYLTAV